MDPKDSQAQSTLAREFQDFNVFAGHRNLNKEEMFDEEFLEFVKWFKKDIHSQYTKKDFQRMERNNILALAIGYLVVFGAYLVGHFYFPQYAWYWGIPLFFAAVWCCIKAEVMHMRTHSPVNLTGIKWLDWAIDTFGLACSGVSPNLLKRRHLAAHYNDIGSASKLFSNVWLTFDKVPIMFYLRPDKLIRIAADKKFCDNEMIDRRRLIIETVFFYVYLALFAFELLYTSSYFLLAFHLIPGIFVGATQIIGAIIVHSGTDRRNSWQSNGLMDPDTAQGLFKVTLWWFGIWNANFFINHAVHHAYPQVPLQIINENYKRYFQRILETSTSVRYNEVLNHRIHANILARLPKPGPLDYVIQLGIIWISHAFLMLIAVGLPLPPVLFETFMVDYRIYLSSTGEERVRNKVAFMESIDVPGNFKRIPEPNLYLRFYNFRYGQYKRYLARIDAKKAAAT